MHGKRRELRVNAFSKYVKGTAKARKIAEQLPYNPGRIKITRVDGSVKYIRQSKKDVIKIIAKGARKK